MLLTVSYRLELDDDGHYEIGILNCKLRNAYAVVYWANNDAHTHKKIPQIITQSKAKFGESNFNIGNDTSV